MKNNPRVARSFQLIVPVGIIFILCIMFLLPVKVFGRIPRGAGEPTPGGEAGGNDPTNLIFNSGVIEIVAVIDGETKTPLVDTYEDVNDITNIGFLYNGVDGYFISQGTLNSTIGNGHVPRSNGFAVAEMLPITKVLLGCKDDPETSDIEKFYKKHAFMKRACRDCEAGIPDNHKEKPKEINPWPFDEPGSNYPQEYSFYGGLKGGWNTIGKFPVTSIPPYHYTCNCERSCPTDICPPCIATPSIIHHVGQECGGRPACNPALPCSVPYPDGCSDDFDSLKCIYADALDTNVFATEVKAGGKGKSVDWDIKLTLRFKDRTPPRITDLTGISYDIFPTLCEPGIELPAGVYKATTGDIFKPGTHFKVFDNSEGEIYTMFGAGQKDTPTDIIGWDPSLPETWQWTGNTPGKTPSGSSVTDHVMIPKHILGWAYYTVFAWDQHGILNPGAPRIIENMPNICYNLPGGADLKKEVLEAKPFPHSSEPDMTKFKLEDEEKKDLKLGQRVAGVEGKLYLDDNDWPNLMIRIFSTKDQAALILPPPLPSSALQMIADTSYTNFIEKAYNKQEDLKTAKKYDCVSVVSLSLNNCCDNEKLMDWEFGLSEKPVAETTPTDELIFNNFRMEDYSLSDTDTTGKLIESGTDFGARNGWGASAVVFAKDPLIEDVEYEIAVWADDNVKFTNDPNYAHCQKLMIPPYTGIQKMEITCEDPCQNPKYVKSVNLCDGSSYETSPFKVIFREPSPSALSGCHDESKLKDKYPFIEAGATDYKGNVRKLRVYFSVSDEKTRIRVLEQKHNKN